MQKAKMRPRVTLHSIVVPEQNYHDTSIGDVVKFLQVESARCDPEQQGVRIINMNRMSPSGAEPQKVSMTLGQTSLYDSLVLICKRAELSFKVDSCGVLVYSGEQPPSGLKAEIYKRYEYLPDQLNEETNSNQYPNDESAVFSVALHFLHGKDASTDRPSMRYILLRDKTVRFKEDICPIAVPRIDRITWRDFQDKNTRRVHIPKDLKTPSAIRLVNESELQQKAFVQNDGWKRFRQVYPDARGLISVSQVGFNTDRTEALLYVSYASSELTGSGRMLLLAKIYGRWVVVCTQTVDVN